VSPAATHTAEQAEQAALAVADDLFYRRGIAAVTMAQIRDRSGVSLRRLYSMYPAKADLVGAWLEHRHGAWMTWFEAEVAQRTESGATPVDAIFDSLTAWLVSSDFRGCGFINALAETAELTAAHELVIRAHKQSVIDHLAGFTDQPEALAVIVDGAIVQAAIFKSTKPVEAARRAVAAIFERELTG
jgi:AcrR family transcriptional regulator